MGLLRFGIDHTVSSRYSTLPECTCLPRQRLEESVVNPDDIPVGTKR